MPDLLRRLAVLSLLGAVAVALLAPLSVRSATPLPTSVQRLLSANPQAASLLDRGTASGRGASAALSLVAAGSAIGAERLARPSAPAAPRSVAMEAGMLIVPLDIPAPPPPVTAAAPAPAVVGASVWDLLAQCESSGNWAANTGNGYYGGLQFSLGTWVDYGGAAYAAYPHQATREQQIAVAERVRAVRGFQPWPACRIKLGLP